MSFIFLIDVMEKPVNINVMNAFMLFSTEVGVYVPSFVLTRSCVCVFFSVASGCAEKKTGSVEGEREEDEEEEREEVFTVELQRGPHGLGLALVDGTVRRRLLLLVLYVILHPAASAPFTDFQ